MFCGLFPVDNVDKTVHNLIIKGVYHVEFFPQQIPHYFVDNVEKKGTSLFFAPFAVNKIVDNVDREVGEEGY
jgi:hypothetical protein